MSSPQLTGSGGNGNDVKPNTINPNSPSKSSALHNPITSPPKSDSRKPSTSEMSPHPQITPSSSAIIDLTSPQPSPLKRQSTTPSLTSSRPAPASPASSRPPSTQFDPSSSTSLSFMRDRSASTSSRGGRRVSASSTSSNSRVPRTRSRASSKVRPKSMLGTNIILPEPPSNTSTPASSDQVDSSQNSIPEFIEPSNSELQSQSQSLSQSDIIPSVTDSFQVILPEITIRDFAFQPNDERYHGRGSEIDERSSRGSAGFRWPWKGANNTEFDTNDGEGSGSSSGGWGGFGFLGGWRNKSKGSNKQESSSRPTFDDDDEEDDDDDEMSDDEDDDRGFGKIKRGEEEDVEYYSSPTQSDSGGDTFGYSYNILEPLPVDVEPKGYYRAAYPFEAISSSEMDLQEGDLLSLTGRGNGDPGWVIARRVRVLAGKIQGIDEKVGLVPESYLERVEIIEE